MLGDGECIKQVKIGLLGDDSVGKTSICHAFSDIEFDPDQMKATIGADKYERKYSLKNGKEIKVAYWDTDGQERFRAAVIKTIRFVREIIIVFQLTDRKSFEDVIDFLQTVKENWSNPKIVLFGNKIDIDKKEWKVTSEEAKEFAKKHNLPYFEMSAKTRQGVNEGFSYAIEEAYHMAEEELNKNKIIIPKKNNNNNNNSGCPGNKKKKK